MNWKLLGMMVTLIGVGASVALGQGTTPTIVQGDYISNVFGNSNFIKNPNAKLNTKDVTFTGSQVARSATTPLVATSEFNLSLLQNANADWSTRTFDAGMKGQNCEARFTYRGFATATTTAQIIQNSLVVAQLVLTPSTDPRIASINFPCGDLSFGTTFRIAQTTAAMTGTNEIGGIYIGLATNMANVAQAEFVGSVTLPGGTNCIPTSNTVTYTLMTGATNCGTASYTGNLQNFSQDPFGFEIRNLKIGTYQVVVSGSGFGLNSNGESRFYLQDTTNSISSMQKRVYTAAAGESVFSNETFTLEYTSQPSSTATFRFYALRSPSGNASFYGNATNFRISVYRFPSSSELVVKPETQNVFAAASWTANYSVNRTSTAEITVSSVDFSTNRTAFGKAQFTANANDVAITVPNMPAGTYRIELTAANLGGYSNTVGNSDTGCFFYIKDGSGMVGSASSNQYGGQYTQDYVTAATQVYTYTSVATRTFTASLAAKNTVNQFCNVSAPKIIITPLDQPSNSALYVQGPVLGAQTGAAIPAGYVGETYANNSSADYFAGLNTYASLTLNPGVWMIFGKAVAVDSAGASSTLVDGSCLISTNVAADPVGMTTAYTLQGDYFIFGGTGNPSANGQMRNPNGSNLTVFSLTSQQTVYLRCRLAFSTGSYAGRGSLRAVRIN